MSNLYPPGFLDYAVATPGRVLDCGAGGRTHDSIDVTVEYQHHPANTVTADGLALPFRTGSFVAVLSQAVLEHVTDPQQAVNELARVTEPGGVIWLEAAFLQPVHMAPHHYFNITPYGMQLLAQRAGLEVVTLDPIGTDRDTLDWIRNTQAGRSTIRGSGRGQPCRLEAASGIRALCQQPERTTRP